MRWPSITGMAFVAKGIGVYILWVSRVPFIPPAIPVLRSRPPTGENWQPSARGWKIANRGRGKLFEKA